MDESKPDVAVHLPQQPMLALQQVAEIRDPVHEILPALTVMVDVDLDVSNAELGHRCERFDKFRAILLFGEEEGVLWRATRCVAHC
jgi:hypothetical protein